MKKNYICVALIATAMSFGSCSGFLDTTPDTLLTQDQTYGDATLSRSVLANFYGRITLGQHLADWGTWTMMDEAIDYGNHDDESIDRNKWRPYDYTLIRDLNQFLQGVKESTAVDEATKKTYIGEAKYIRAWLYFCMGRTLGGVPIMGDEVYTYDPNMDITTLQVPRSTEAELYDYVISECREAADMLSKSTNTNSARANYWVCKMLEARAALTAASLATYNTAQEHPLLRTEGGEIGIPASRAQEYYQTALAAAKDVIENGPYTLMTTRENTVSALADNFYKAVCQKDGNTEVIWTRDYISPGQTHNFTQCNLPKSIEQDTGSDNLSALLNTVEAFEPINASEEQRGTTVPFEVGTPDNPVFFDQPTDLFEQRDPRLMGSILVPGSTFGGQAIELQAGQLVRENGSWVEKTSSRNSYDDNHNLITANNGPFAGNEREINRTGFYIRKYLDETPAAGTIGRGSAMWNVYFRLSEAYLMAAEATWELSRNDKDATALAYINKVRERAGIQPLTTIDHARIMHEYQVEFAFEGHRWWNLKRWMQADKIWTGDPNVRTSQRLGLWPFKVVAPGDANNGKWVFVEKNMQTLDLYRRPLKCLDEHYYSTIDNGWINNNPKLVKNPYQ
ncbi:MAG: RagB/SusD family nutrient uptake outer membrane protein [Bacteroidales bacterium]|nr:RagB/SusD family nutrient uptake outer membrane protein [Bacteroidales bacterium]